VQGIIERSPILKEMISKGEIGIIGGIHDIASGTVTFFEND
jgi:carbonic anhydrase